MRKVRRVDLSLEQLAIECLRRRGFRRIGGRAVGDEIRHRRAAARQVRRDDVAQVVGPDDEQARAGD